MIDGYKITKQNDNEVLFLYLNFNYEFGSFNNKPFFKNIKEFVKKINFKGTKIFIVASGIIVGTLIINPVNLNSVQNEYNYVSKIIIHNYYDDNLVNYEIKVSNDKVSNNDIKSNIIEKEYEKSVKKSEVVNNETIVSIHRSDNSILNIELEKYIVGVVASEMPASFNIEALKAGAVVARTYALKSIQDGRILTDTVSTQVYKDNFELKKLWGNDFDKYYSKITEAVNTTKGKVILYNNEYIDAVYHSTSNGLTENSENVWGNNVPYLMSVKSYDEESSSFKRMVAFSKEEFCSLLFLDVLEPITYELIHNNTGRVSVVIINNKIISGTKFRQLLNLRSTDFDIEIDNDIYITTRGYGHGVGMSQYGAQSMSKLGYDYIQILKHYYTGVTIK